MKYHAMYVLLEIRSQSQRLEYVQMQKSCDVIKFLVFDVTAFKIHEIQ